MKHCQIIMQTNTFRWNFGLNPDIVYDPSIQNSNNERISQWNLFLEKSFCFCFVFIISRCHSLFILISISILFVLRIFSRCFLWSVCSFFALCYALYPHEREAECCLNEYATDVILHIEFSKNAFAYWTSQCAMGACTHHK